MYLRYLAKYYNEKTDKECVGFFWAADYLQHNLDLHIPEREKLDELIHWFDHNLAIPEYYQDPKNRQKAKSATSWFKDSASQYISRMNELAKILESQNIEVQRINSKTLQGKVIFEDDFQATIIPYRDIAKHVT